MPQAPADLLEKARNASPPPKIPRGFFDVLVVPTRLLLDNGFKLTQAADWLIAEGRLKPQHRPKFYFAMANRISRFKQKVAAAGERVQWREPFGYESAHAVGNGTTAMCGFKTGMWVAATGNITKCARCQGIVKRQGLTIAE